MAEENKRWDKAPEEAVGPAQSEATEPEQGEVVELAPIVYTMPEVARLLCIGRATAYKLANQADFPSFRRGRSVRVRKDDLDEWIERKKEAGEEW